MPDLHILYSEPLMYRRISASASWSIGEIRHRAATEIGSQLQRLAPLVTSNPTDASVRIFVDQSGITDDAHLHSLPNEGHFYAIVPAPRSQAPPQLEQPSPPSTASLQNPSTPAIFQSMSSPIGDTLRGHIQKAKNAEEEKNDLKARMQALEEMMMRSEEEMKEMKETIMRSEERMKGKMKSEQDHRDETERQLRKEIQDMEAQLADTSGFLVHGHTEALDRLRLRNLLDEAQAVLAHACGLVSTSGDSDDTVTPGQRWRIHLAKASGKEDQARLANARSMLKGPSSTSDPLRQFLSSPSGDLALTMATQRFSAIRKGGDAVAHESRLSPATYEKVIERSGGSPAQQAALKGLLALVNNYKH